MNELLTMLDTKYKRLEYIQSTGTQYIDTGVSGVGLEIEHDIQFKVTTTRQLMGFVANHINYWGINASGYYELANNATTVLAGNRDKVTYKKIDVSHAELYINGNLEKSYSSGTTEITTTYNLFRMYGYTTLTCSCKLYSCRVKQNNVLVRNFVPVLRKSDNEIGMLDLVEGKFYGNAGTGKFTANLDTMYAIIQGTPTVQDGVASGFSDSNYIITNQALDTSKDFIIVIKVIFTEISVANTIINDFFKIALGASNNKIRSYIFDSNNNAISNGQYGVTTFSSNIPYLIKFSRIGNTIKIESSPDNGTTWITENTWTSAFKIKNTGDGVAFGNSVNQNNQYLRGSIDLNRSYIKIDDTKYKLQAVVGYSQPSGSSVTITNGVASGFSSANYLKIANRELDLKNIVFHTVFNTGTLTTSLQGIMVFSTTGGVIPFGFYLQNKKLNVFYNGAKTSGTIYSVISSTLSDNTNYEVEFGTRNTHRYCKFGSVGNMVEVSLTMGNDEDWNGNISKPVFFGNVESALNQIFNGSIDLNNTYIKINNKLWFNGQQA